MKKLRKIKLERIDLTEVRSLSGAKLSRIKGGYTSSTATVTPTGGSDDGKDMEGD
jgi:natural product precursor